MTFDEYISGERTPYEGLAAVVESILVAAVQSIPDLRLQQTQRRAKSPVSLRRKLERARKLTAPDIENFAKDLAGCRLIFYTNSDVSKFLSSGVVRDNFEVDWDRTKIHHPTSDTSSAAEQFVSNNYVVRLKADRATLPEYSSVADLWCEVQVQTSLNHAWAEMAHDTIYKKPDLPGGFGAKLMESIERRMAGIMREHLLPAGYEFQKVLNDFERLSTGKELFDRGLLQSISECADNNNRYELLERFVEYVLPHYDDVGTVYPEIREGLRATIEQARTTADRPIETPFGTYPGHTQSQVIGKAADVIDRLRYLDVEGTFEFILEMFSGSTETDDRQRWVKSGEELAKHELHVWQQAGPIVQQRILSQIKRLPKDKKVAARGVLVAMLEKILESEITGTDADFGKVTFRRGAVPFSTAVQNIRASAIRLLKLFFLTASDEDERKQALTALHEATRFASAGDVDDKAHIEVLENSADIVRFYAQHASRIDYTSRASVEHKVLWMQRHHPEPSAEAAMTKIGMAVSGLRREIELFRESINTDEQFLRYKTLVGYESVFDPSWTDADFDISAIDDYRSKKIDEYVAGISDANASEWQETVRTCASTQSNDLATFPKFGEFLEKLARAKPDIALRFFEADDAILSNFLPSLLRGFELSEDGPDVAALKRKWMASGKYVSPVIWSYRTSISVDADVLEEALEHAIAHEDRQSLYNLVTVANARNADVEGGLVDRVLIPGISALSALGEFGWPRAVWVGRKSAFSQLSEEQADDVLQALIPAPELDWDDEEVLAGIAQSYARMVVDFFSKRLAHELEPNSRYDAIPYEFTKLQSALLTESNYVMQSARQWYVADPHLFPYRGGKFIRNVFRGSWPLLEDELRKLLGDSDDDVGFVVRVLRTFEGEEFLYPLVKDVVHRLDPQSDLLNEVEYVLDESGVVSGEFGFVELFQARREKTVPWLEDPRQPVREFAERYIRSLDRRIAAEQRRAEEDYELRRRNWGVSDDEPSGDDGEQQ